MRALERRREEELGPALALLRDARRETADPLLGSRIDRLAALLEDVAAIDAQARRLSSSTLRRLIGAGGVAARTAERLFGARERTGR